MEKLPIPLSVIVITRNEEENIGACLESVLWADDIIVVDAASEDRTVEIARVYTNKVYVEGWLGFSEAKSFAVQHAEHEWVLWLDADERVPPETAEEIREILSYKNDTHAAYRFARMSYFLGKWIRHCGWYPGYVTRLFRKTHARFSDSKVHEYLQVEGTTGTLKGNLAHFTDNSLDHYFNKFNRYTTLAAEEMIESQRRATILDLVFRPWFVFLKMYIVKAGFLDGVHGFILCRLSASYVFAKYSKAWEKQRQKKR